MISSNIVFAIACITIVGILCATVVLSQLMAMFRSSMENNICQIPPDIIEGELDASVDTEKQLLLSMVVDSNDRIRELQNQVSGLERMVMIMGSTHETGVPTDISGTTIEDDVEMAESELLAKKLGEKCTIESHVEPKYLMNFDGLGNRIKIPLPLSGKEDEHLHIRPVEESDNSDLVELLKLTTEKNIPVPSPDSNTIQIDPKNVKIVEDGEGGTAVSFSSEKLTGFVEEDLSKDFSIRPTVTKSEREPTPERPSDDSHKKEEVKLPQRDSMGRPIISADSIMKKARR